MPSCRRCHTLCDEGDKFCSYCGSPLLTEDGISSQDSRIGMKEENGNREEKLHPADPGEARNASLQIVLRKKEEIEKPMKRIICPRCKIIYERGNDCVRCGSPLVENSISAESEAPLWPCGPEVCAEEPLSSGLESQDKVLKETHPPEGEDKPFRDLSHEPFPLHPLPSQMIQRVSSPRESVKKGLRSSLELVMIIILIAVPGYLIWPILRHFTVEKPEASTSTSIKVDHLTSPRSPATGNSSKAAAEPTPSVPTHSNPPFAEREALGQIKSLLENIRQANLKKDIDLFMSCYSYAYEGREGKRKETIESWQNFNYLHLSYDLKNHSISNSTAQAKVVWLMRFSPKAGGQFEESKAVLEVTFRKEEGGWKIREIRTLS